MRTDVDVPLGDIAGSARVDRRLVERLGLAGQHQLHRLGVGLGGDRLHLGREVDRLLLRVGRALVGLVMAEGAIAEDAGADEQHDEEHAFSRRRRHLALGKRDLVARRLLPRGLGLRARPLGHVRLCHA